MPIDDLILTWLSPEPCPTSPDSISDDKVCPSCGYVGEMIIEERSYVCLACFGTLPKPLDERIVHCPNCELEIELTDGDRNKTIVCSRCMFLLGCVYRD